MKKLFISCPMKGFSEEDIRKNMNKMHKLAEIMFDQELEVIPTYIEHKLAETTNDAILYLGESIKKMAMADYFIGIGFSSYFRGCSSEYSVARNYDIPAYVVSVNDLIPNFNKDLLHLKEEEE